MLNLVDVGNNGKLILNAIKNSETLQAVWNTIKGVFEGVWDVLNKIAKVLTGEDLDSRINALVKSSGKLDANKVASDAAAIRNNMQNNNQTYNLTVNAGNANAQQTAGLVGGWLDNRIAQDRSMDVLEPEA